MTTAVSTRISLEDGLELVIYVDVSFDSARGLEIDGWEVFHYEPGVKRMWLKTFDVSYLKYDEFITVANELAILSANALNDDEIYSELEEAYMEELKERA